MNLRDEIRPMLRLSVPVVTVQLGLIGRDHPAGGVVPRTVANSVACVDGARTLRAQVGDPLDASAAGCLCQHLAMGIRAGQAAVVGAVALGNAGDEEAHGLSRLLRLLGQGDKGAERN